jgi:transcriptional regulator with XRE-family HTH domain
MNHRSSIASPTRSFPSPSVNLPKGNFGALLRRWRAIRRVSQLDLTLEAEISMRHLSCVETGRAQPSREMVVRLADALQVPLRERNLLLAAAGYAPLYRQTALDTTDMDAARFAVELLLAQQEPYPGIVVDRYWNILQMNAGMDRFLALFPTCDLVLPRNAIRLVFHPQGLRPHIENWRDVAARLIQRVHREVIANPTDEKMRRFLDELLGYPDVPNRWRAIDLDAVLPALLTINYRPKLGTLRLFATLTTFSTPQDIALQELRIESFFPADQETRTALTSL